MKLYLSVLTATFVLLTSCGKQKSNEEAMNQNEYAEGTFGFDLNFLKERDDVIVLKQDSSQIIVSPKYQAKVFTSTAKGFGGKSFGWINYEAFDGEEDPHMNAYGGENRFWLGPEGGKFSLFFKPGTEMVFENWKTPAAIDTESWEVSDKNEESVTMVKEMSLLNYNDTQLEILATRKVSILSNDEVESLLDVKLNDVAAVGFETENVITNTGDKAWTEQTGAPCIWILDMFNPSAEAIITIPYHQDASGPVATTDYFGQIPDDRVTYDSGQLFFKADGKSRGKLGIPPARAKNVAGSYDPANKLLTITLFDVDNEAIYLNQEWTPDKDPLKGDAVNAYNDGPLEDGSQMGPFYEIESVSPAAFLQPEEKLSHKHSVFHFTGDEGELNKISTHVLGVSLEAIQSAFGS
ncbi:MAG: DUF6786 family protein [Fulvivirga sp.]